MARLIDADALFADSRAEYKKNPCFTNYDVYMSEILKEIDDMPTVDAVPVRHGTWAREVLGSTSGYGTTVMYQCSECEKMSISEHKYCPNCGARMDEEANETN